MPERRASPAAQTNSYNLRGSKREAETVGQTIERRAGMFALSTHSFVEILTVFRPSYKATKVGGY